MFSPIHPKYAGVIEEINGLHCHLPGVGWLYDDSNPAKKMEWKWSKTYERSNTPLAQYWERDPRFVQCEAWYAEEEEKRLTNPNYVHSELEAFRDDCFRWRTAGFWFKNKGKSTYITGDHWFYLSMYSPQKGKYMKFRDSDRKIFYQWQHAVEDPLAVGMILSVKRRYGKTAISAAILLNAGTMYANAHLGIQSMNDYAAEVTVFQLAVVAAYRNLPSFMRPKCVLHRGEIPKSGLHFKHGKMDSGEPELNTLIDYQSSKAKAYDGKQLLRFVGDETSKTDVADVVVRHSVITRALTDIDSKIVGKALYTSTVGEGKAVEPFKKLWKDSNHRDPKKGLRTGTQMRRCFLPADEARDFDRYGFCDKEANRKAILESRRALEGTPMLAAEIRNEALNEFEMFYASDEECIFDNPQDLGDRYTTLTLIGQPRYRTGDFEWVDGDDPDNRYVRFVDRSNGRTQLLYDLPEEYRNNVSGGKGNWKPENKDAFFAGGDPINHDIVSDSHERRKSIPSLTIVKGESVRMPSEYDNVPILLYNARPSLDVYYDDMIKIVHYFGCSVLFETQTAGIIKHFTDNGYAKFLAWLPGAKAPGVPANRATTDEMSRLWAVLLQDHLHNMWFETHIKQCIEFDPTHTTKSDAYMSGGYALLLKSLAPGNRNKNKGKGSNMPDKRKQKMVGAVRLLLSC